MASYIHGFFTDDMMYGKGVGLGLPGNSTTGSSNDIDFNDGAGGCKEDCILASSRVCMRSIERIEDPSSDRSSVLSESLYGDGEPIEANISSKDAGT